MSSELDMAQEALDELFSTRLHERESAQVSTAPVFELKEVQGDDRPVLIQCCIR